MKPSVEVLNSKITNGCNLSCAGCSHHSQIALPNSNLNLESIIKDLKKFNERIHVSDHISVLGGEVLLEKNWSDFLSEVFNIFNSSTKVRFYTNGLLIHKNIDDIEMHVRKGCELRVSIHEAPHTKRGKLVIENIKLLNDRKIPFIVSQNFLDFWGNAVIEKGDKIYPHNSHSAEESKKWGCFCPNTQLYKGRIYKCAQTAYIKDRLKTTNQLDDPEWSKYLEYDGLSIYDASDTELIDFCKTQYKPSWFCTQCPAFNNTIPRKQESLSKKKLII